MALTVSSVSVAVTFDDQDGRLVDWCIDDEFKQWLEREVHVKGKHPLEVRNFLLRQFEMAISHAIWRDECEKNGLVDNGH